MFYNRFDRYHSYPYRKPGVKPYITNMSGIGQEKEGFVLLVTSAKSERKHIVATRHLV